MGQEKQINEANTQFEHFSKVFNSSRNIASLLLCFFKCESIGTGARFKQDTFQILLKNLNNSKNFLKSQQQYSNLCSLSSRNEQFLFFFALSYFLRVESSREGQVDVSKRLFQMLLKKLKY